MGKRGPLFADLTKVAVNAYDLKLSLEEAARGTETKIRLPTMDECATCHGTGKIVADPCSTCKGAGRVKRHKTLLVKIPAGVDQGERIR